MKLWEDKPHTPDTRTFLYREGRFADLIIFAWANIETDFSWAVAAEFGLHYTDERTEFIDEKLTFETKKEFLSRRGSWKTALNRRERDTICKFQEFRNDLFHDLRANQFGYSPEVKDTLMLMAVEAMDASHKLMDCSFKKNKPRYKKHKLVGRAWNKSYFGWKPQRTTKTSLLGLSKT